MKANGEGLSPRIWFRNGAFVALARCNNKSVGLNLGLRIPYPLCQVNSKHVTGTQPAVDNQLLTQARTWRLLHQSTIPSLIPYQLQVRPHCLVGLFTTG